MAGAIKCRGAPSSHHRGVSLFKLFPPSRGYSQPDYYEPLHSGPMVQPADMTSSVPCCSELEFGLSRHRDASCTVATWLPRDRKPAQVAELWEGGWGEGAERRRGGGGWKTESEEEISSLRRMRERLEEWRRGGGGGRRQARFLIKVDHSQQP